MALFATSSPRAGETAQAGLSHVSARNPDQNAERRIPLSLVVDGVTKADNVIVISRESDMLVKASDLAAAHVPVPDAVFVTVGDARYVSLRSLAPQVTYTIDSTAIALELTVAPSLLGHTEIALGEPPAYGQLAQADPSAFLTYSVTSDTANTGDGASGFLQAGAGSAAAGLITASGSYSGGEAHRGLFAYQRESEQHLSRITLGDEYASTGDLGANSVIVGLGATRHFEFQPEYAYFPTPGLRGSILSPTTADLYVNGTLVRSVQLAPGTFDLSGIPVNQGAGVTQILLHDAFGNTRALGGLYYQTRSLLRKGLTDYDYHVGFLRPDPFAAVDRYGPLAALGEYRVGLSDNLTVGGRFERTAGLESGGPHIDVGSPFGHVSLEGSASSAFGQSGRAFGAAYDYLARGFGIGLSGETQSADYATASLATYAARQRSNVRANLGLPLSRLATLDVSNTVTSYTGLPSGAQFLADITYRPPRRSMYVMLNAERDTGGSIFGIGAANLEPVTVTEPVTGPGQPAGVPIYGLPRSSSAARWTFGATVTLLTGRNTNAMLGTSDAAGSASTTIALTRSPPLGPGFGYQIQGTTGADRSALAAITYDTQYANVQSFSSSGAGPSSTSLTLSGALVAFHQGVFFSQPVNGAFALVSVPGFAHLPVFFNNEYAGRTDRRGEMVVANLSPYYDNRVGIDDLHDRLDVAEDASAIDVRPKNLSGVVTQFTIHHFHAFAGNIVVNRRGRSIVPILGRLIFNRAGIDYQSDLGRKGQFYVENLASGDYGATVESTNGLICAFRVALRADARPVTSVGTLTCDTP